MALPPRPPAARVYGVRGARRVAREALLWAPRAALAACAAGPWGVRGWGLEPRAREEV